MVQNETVEPNITKHLNLLVCPACHSSLKVIDNSLSCTNCGRTFGFDSGIPLLYWPTSGVGGDVTELVKAFYEENPFPGYDSLDTADRLVEKSRKGVFARLLDNQISCNSLVLEVGCGTGQLSNFLGIAGRTVFGTDICMNSLRLGRRFRLNNGLQSVHFIQMNLFKPVFVEEAFDIVLCNGVLHHTSDPFIGFCSISALVRPGGHIVIGLYNKFGRMWTDIRRAIFRLLGNRLHFLDPYLRRSDVDRAKKRVWFADQYLNPQESEHTFDEVLAWFDKTGFEFVNSVPKLTPSAQFAPQESLFRVNPRGTRLDHLFAQLRLALSGDSEGGFFVMIGKKKSPIV